MRISGVAAVLTVYFDGQFWVGVAERRDCKGVCACRTVFGAEPSDGELLQWVSRTWERLPWSAAVEDVVAPVPAGLAANPKRRKREAARALAERGASTKAQLALAAERERAKDKAVSARARARREEADRHYAEHVAKRKRRRRGR